MHEDLFDRIESDRYSATMNVVSGLTPFVRAIVSSVEFQEILARVRSDADLAAVLGRFNDVADRRTDPAHESPWDVAIAAYLLLLNTVEPQQAALCAERARSQTNGWWSRKVADQVVSGSHGSLLEPAQQCPPISSGV